MTTSLTPEKMDHLVEIALNEDLGTGDVTTDSIVSEDNLREAALMAKEPLVVCGLELARRVFAALEPESQCDFGDVTDGSVLSPGAVLGTVRARGSVLLKGERTALNILQHLSGIATLTRKYVDVAGPVTVLDTRKTTPGLRVFEKYAVHCGGGTNHRFGLFDMVLIKDNHIKMAGGIASAVARVRSNKEYTGTIEVETTTLKEVREALECGVDVIMLDNMDLKTIREAVDLIQGRAKTEVSGSMTLDKLEALQGTGVDYVSVGALTHSAPAVDISMNFLA